MISFPEEPAAKSVKEYASLISEVEEAGRWQGRDIQQLESAIGPLLPKILKVWKSFDLQEARLVTRNLRVIDFRLQTAGLQEHETAKVIKQLLQVLIIPGNASYFEDVLEATPRESEVHRMALSKLIELLAVGGPGLNPDPVRALELKMKYSYLDQGKEMPDRVKKNLRDLKEIIKATPWLTFTSIFSQGEPQIIELNKIVIQYVSEDSVCFYYRGPVSGDVIGQMLHLNSTILEIVVPGILRFRESNLKYLADEEKKLGVIITDTGLESYNLGPEPDKPALQITRKPGLLPYQIHYYHFESKSIQHLEIWSLRGLELMVKTVLRQHAQSLFLLSHPNTIFGSPDPTDREKIYCEEKSGVGYVVKAFAPYSYRVVSSEIYSLDEYEQAVGILKEKAYVLTHYQVNVEQALNGMSKTASRLKAPVLTEEQRKRADLNLFQTAFDKIIFDEPAKPFYRKRPRNYNALKDGLAIVLGVMNGTNTTHTAVPNDPKQREAMLDPIDRYLRGIILLLQEKVSQSEGNVERVAELNDQFQSIALTLAEYGLHCATNWEGDITPLYELATKGEVTEAVAIEEFNLKEFLQSSIDRRKLGAFQEMLLDGRGLEGFDESHGARFYDLVLWKRGYTIHPQKRGNYADIYAQSGRKGRYRSDREVNFGFREKCSSAELAMSVAGDLNDEIGRPQSSCLFKALQDPLERALLHDTSDNAKEYQRLVAQYEKKVQEIRARTETDLSTDERAILQALHMATIRGFKSTPELEVKVRAIVTHKPNKLEAYADDLQRLGIEIVDYEKQINKLYPPFRGAVEELLESILKEAGLIQSTEAKTSITMKGAAAMLHAEGFFERKETKSTLAQIEDHYKCLMAMATDLEHHGNYTLVDKIKSLLQSCEKEYELLIAKACEEAKAKFPDNPVYALAETRTLSANTTFYCAGNEETIRDVVRGGIHTELPFSMEEPRPNIDQGENFAIRCRLDRSLTGAFIFSGSVLKAAGFSQEQISHGYMSLDNRYPFFIVQDSPSKEPYVIITMHGADRLLLQNLLTVKNQTMHEVPFETLVRGISPTWNR